MCVCACAFVEQLGYLEVLVLGQVVCLHYFADGWSFILAHAILQWHWLRKGLTKFGVHIHE